MQEGDAARLFVTVHEVAAEPRNGWLPRARTVHLVEAWERRDDTWRRAGAVPAEEYLDHCPEHRPVVRRWLERDWHRAGPRVVPRWWIAWPAQ